MLIAETDLITNKDKDLGALGDYTLVVATDTASQRPQKDQRAQFAKCFAD